LRKATPRVDIAGTAPSGAASKGWPWAARRLSYWYISCRSRCALLIGSGMIRSLRSSGACGRRAL